MLFEDDRIKTVQRDDLFDEGFASNTTIEDNDDFERNSIKTPDIKIMTPLRRNKKPDFDDMFSGDFNSIFKMPVPKSPVPDYSDENDINERVKKLINNSTDVRYDTEHEKVQDAVREAFEIKFKNLSINYPDHNIDFPSEKNLNTIHKHYHSIIKSIYVNMNLGQTQLSYILVLMVLEFICVKVFSVPMSGFTKMEMKRMYKYNSLMIELGEAMYVSGQEGEPQSIEWRITTTFIWNIVIFLGIKIISNYVGGDAMTDTIRNIIDKLMENNINAENIESGEAKKINEEDNNLFSGLFGKGDGTSELAELVSTLGTSFTQKMENSKRNPGPKKKSRFIFNE